MGVPVMRTGQPAGVPSVALGSAFRRPRADGRPRPDAALAGAEQDTCQALSDLYQRHYGSLCRAAALLTGGDTGTVETVVVESFVALSRLRTFSQAPEQGLPCLHRLLVARARRTAHHHRSADGQRPLIRALHALPTGQREAVVLTLYLGLTAEQAAAAMRVSQAAAGRYLAAARTTLSGRWPPGS
ncbi:MAG TPA: sigma factor-like helix-turn-helix DNA-binding protein [Streptosporangiaceae bacterium]